MQQFLFKICEIVVDNTSNERIMESVVPLIWRNTEMEKQFTTDETAEILRLNKKTLLKYINQGRIRASVSGRRYIISREAIEEYLKNGEVKVG